MGFSSTKMCKVRLLLGFQLSTTRERLFQLKIMKEKLSPMSKVLAITKERLNMKIIYNTGKD